MCACLCVCFSHMDAHQEQMVLKPVCLFSQDGEIGESEEKQEVGGKRGIR